MASESEQERRETLADIERDLRDRADCAERHGDRETHNDGVAMLLRSIADRIEAAAKREVVSKKETTTIGNAAAMREALVWMSERMNAAVHDGSLDCHEALRKIEAALSAPARNCDKFVTQPEMSRAYEEYRKSAMKNYRNGLTGRVPTVKQKPMTYDEWLLAPAAEEGAGK